MGAADVSWLCLSRKRIHALIAMHSPTPVGCDGDHSHTGVSYVEV